MTFFEKDFDYYLPLIRGINKETKYCIKEFGDTYAITNFFRAQEANVEIEEVVSAVLSKKKKTVSDIDNIIKKLASECVPIKSESLKNQLDTKKINLFRFSYSSKRNEINKSIPILNTTIESISKSLNKYPTRNIDALVIVAVPIEFRAMFRKLAIVTKAENYLFLKILDENKDTDKSFRQNFWVEGVIIRNEKWVKIVLQFPEEYGSIKSQSSTNRTLNQIDEFLSFSEALLVGVAGQMSVEKNVKIGDLVISNGFYNAYDQKAKSKISYSNRTPILLEDDYDKFLGDLNNWKPSNMLVPKPKVQQKDKERIGRSQIKKGYFVSGPPVVKNKMFKENILNHFPDSIAVEMEATGCFEALKNFNMNLKIVKSICDWSDKSKTKEWQPFCSELAAEFTVDYLIAKYGKPII